uniref:Uncharacterized protein n=1 Tax=Anguilla anguilla TaxID=7936 RepID=A0A0E9XHR3_ANGAN
MQFETNLQCCTVVLTAF